MPVVNFVYAMISASLLSMAFTLYACMTAKELAKGEIDVESHASAKGNR